MNFVNNKKKNLFPNMKETITQITYPVRKMLRY